MYLQTRHIFHGALMSAPQPSMAHTEESPITILVVATPDTDRKTLQFLFTPPGYQLFFTNNCNQALVDGPSIQPDLILVDAEPYDTNGLQTSQRLRSDPLLAKIPILLMTGQSNHETWQKALQAGATDLIQTPCQPLALQARANTLAASHRFQRYHHGFEDRNSTPKHTLQRSPDLRVLRRVIEAISTKLDPQEILQSTCEMMSQVLPFQRINAWLLEEDDDRFELLVELSMAPTAQVAGDLYPNDGNTRPSNSFGNYMPTGRYPWLRELIRAKKMLSLSGNPAAVPQQPFQYTRPDHRTDFLGGRAPGQRAPPGRVFRVKRSRPSGAAPSRTGACAECGQCGGGVHRRHPALPAAAELRRIPGPEPGPADP